MSFLGGLFSSARSESVALIDIGAASVGGGYAYFPKKGEPVLAYTKRVDIPKSSEEPREKAMARALGELGASLVKEGAPALYRATGSGSVHAVLVSISAPWQKTTLRTERFEDKKRFTFTHRMLSDAIKNSSVAPEGKMLVDESVIAILLNGYETKHPVGRKVGRAAIVVLSSFIEETVARLIATALKDLFHTRRVLSIAGSSLRYQALRNSFEHEKEYLILDASGSEAVVSLVRKGRLRAITEVESKAPCTPEWANSVSDSLAELAKRYPLPRTIFLLTEPGRTDDFKAALTEAELGKLWLTDAPPNLITVLPSHVSKIHSTSEAQPDLPLLLMSLYWSEHGNDPLS